MNLYAYVGNSPLNLVDPFGLLSRDVVGIPNLLWQKVREQTFQELQRNFGGQFTPAELGQLADRFADTVTMKELSNLRDPKTLPQIGERIREKIQRSGTPQEKELARRFEEALRRKATGDDADDAQRPSGDSEGK